MGHKGHRAADVAAAANNRSSAAGSWQAGAASKGREGGLAHLLDTPLLLLAELGYTPVLVPHFTVPGTPEAVLGIRGLAVTFELVEGVPVAQLTSTDVGLHCGPAGR